jgi:hypothetical protein
VCKALGQVWREIPGQTPYLQRILAQDLSLRDAEEFHLTLKVLLFILTLTNWLPSIYFLKCVCVCVCVCVCLCLCVAYKEKKLATVVASR